MGKRAKSFEFIRYNLQNELKISLEYAVIFEDGQRQSFEELITLPKPVRDVPSGQLDSVLHALHLLSGISYWKLYCPKEIIVRTKTLSRAQAQFWNTVYTKGLGEFFFQNKIDFRGLVQFPSEDIKANTPKSVKRQFRALISNGGGKDSVVSFELFKKMNYPADSFILETQKSYSVIDDVSKKMGTSVIRIKRQIDTKLFELSKTEDTFNGHIPITALYSMIGVLSAVLYDYKYVIVANEKSADYGNVEYLGQTINHQWSKSLEFEELFQKYVNSFINAEITYFSLLRPWSELRIAQEFSKYQSYFPLFSSCNTNFTINTSSASQGSRWCGNCAKCAFVFVVLSGFLSKETVVKIFGKNLFQDETLLTTFKELLGVENSKPFECVGTPEEVKAAFYLAYKKGEFKNDSIMTFFEENVLSTLSDPDDLVKETLALGDSSHISDEFKNLLE